MSQEYHKALCAITGSNGYVGGCVKNYFTACGWDILELSRNPKPGTRAAAFKLGADLAPDVLAGVDALVHCAYDFKPLYWSEIHSVNVLGSQKLFQAARKAGVKRIIFISSISAYEGCRSRYGRAKWEIEKFAEDYGAPIIRPGLVYGRGPGGMFGRLAAQIQKSSIVPLIGDGSQIQYLVYQEDLCAFIEKLSGRSAPSPRLLTAAHDRPWPFKALLREIARGLHKEIKFIPLPWRFIWLGLKAAEGSGFKLNFRSDSLVSLMYPNPHPDFSPNAAAGLKCRPFAVEELLL